VDKARARLARADGSYASLVGFIAGLLECLASKHATNAGAAPLEGGERSRGYR
jgi:hypothetical protein